MADQSDEVQAGTESSQRQNTRSGISLETPPLGPTHFTITNDNTIGEVIVCCVYWGDKYPPYYVQKLKSMVARNLPLPHRFVCLSDRQIPGVDCIPVFANYWTGWWQKVALFMPRLFPSGARILYLDLDVVITGDLELLVRQWTAKPLVMIYNFGPNRGHAAHNSSVMLWTAGDTRLNAIHDLFTDDVMKKLHGDQCWIWRVLRDDISNWPHGLIASYKYEARNKKRPDPTTRIVVFHGDPKPHQCREEWIEFYWQ